jgi:hypothetical protein
LIVITGLLKAMRYVYPIPGDVLYWASAIHVGAMVLLAIKVLDHMRYVLAPSRWPLMQSMLTGWVHARYAQVAHAAWYGRLGDEPRTEDVPATSAPLGSAGRGPV